MPVQQEHIPLMDPQLDSNPEIKIQIALEDEKREDAEEERLGASDQTKANAVPGRGSYVQESETGEANPEEERERQKRQRKEVEDSLKNWEKEQAGRPGGAPVEERKEEGEGHGPGEVQRVYCWVCGKQFASDHLLSVHVKYSNLHKWKLQEGQESQLHITTN
jgi:hypothetical protein